MSEIFHVWTVHRNNSDMYLGPVTDVCSSEALAEKIAHRSGWYGGDAPTCKTSAVRVDGKVYLLVNDAPVDLDGTFAKQKAEIQKQALAKLSQDEIEALGIDLNSMED